MVDGTASLPWQHFERIEGATIHGLDRVADDGVADLGQDLRLMAIPEQHRLDLGLPFTEPFIVEPAQENDLRWTWRYGYRTHSPDTYTSATEAMVRCEGWIVRKLVKIVTVIEEGGP
jgi:hypothetical protein